MASFRKTASGHQAQIAITGAPREAKTFSTKAEARAWAAGRETEIRNGIKTGIQTDRTVDHAFKRYAADVSPTKGGSKWELVRLNAIGQMDVEGIRLGSMRLCDVSSDVLGKLRDLRLRGRPAAPGVRAMRPVLGSTVNREFNLLSHVFSTAASEWKWIAKSPTTEVRRSKEGPSRDRLASEDEIDRICHALGFSQGGEEQMVKTLSQATAVAFLFAIETGMRAGEICNLRPDKIKGQVATLPKTKNGTKREVPLSTRAVELLQLLPPCEPDQPVFGLKTGSRDSLFRKAKERALVEDLTFHDSRHIAITRLARKLDILALARMVGHKDLRKLQIYYNETAADIAARLG